MSDSATDDGGSRYPMFEGILPVDRARIPADALAGVTLAALAIPEVMGYTTIAGMPVITGLYTILLPLAVFAVFGSSRHLVVGADSATAAVMAAGLAGLAATGSTQYVALAGLLALHGRRRLLILARLVRLGLPRRLPVAHGADRVPHRRRHPGRLRPGRRACSASPDRGHAAARFDKLDRQAGQHARRHQMSWTTVAVSAGVLVTILGLKHVDKKIPGALIAVIGVDRSSARHWDLAAPRRRHARHGARRAARRSASPTSSWSDVARAAGHRGLDLRRDPGPERGDVARLRRQVQRPLRRERRPRRARRWPTSAPACRARSSSTAAPPRRRWSTAPAVAASSRSSRPAVHRAHRAAVPDQAAPVHAQGGAVVGRVPDRHRAVDRRGHAADLSGCGPTSSSSPRSPRRSWSSSASSRASCSRSCSSIIDHLALQLPADRRGARAPTPDGPWTELPLDGGAAGAARARRLPVRRQPLLRQRQPLRRPGAHAVAGARGNARAGSASTPRRSATSTTRRRRRCRRRTASWRSGTCGWCWPRSHRRCGPRWTGSA